MLKRLGTASVAAVGAGGVASAADDQEMYVSTEIDGERVTMTETEFDEHPETRSLSEVDEEGLYCYFDCCACCIKCDGNIECKCRTTGCACY